MAIDPYDPTDVIEQAVEAARPFLVGKSLKEITVTIATIILAVEYMGMCPRQTLLARADAIAEYIQERMSDGLPVN